MNHSIETVIEYVCKFYGLTDKQIKSSSREYYLVRARQMIILLVGHGRDKYIANALKRKRTAIVVARNVCWNNMQYDKNLEKEYDYLRKGLMKYELA